MDSQRLTTLYLIYRYMKNVNPFFSEPAFNLTYQTREQSADFLKTLDMSKQEDNIDFWFIANAYKTIQKWFEQDCAASTDTFLNPNSDNTF